MKIRQVALSLASDGKNETTESTKILFVDESIVTFSDFLNSIDLSDKEAKAITRVTTEDGVQLAMPLDSDVTSWIEGETEFEFQILVKECDILSKVPS